MASLQPWQSFYIVLAGASATLVGLMFVAITLGSSQWGAADGRLLDASFNAFMSPTFIHFVYVLVTAIVVLVPTLTEGVLGGLLVLAGVGSLGHIARYLPFLLRRYREGVADRSDLTWYSVMPSFAYMLYLSAGVGLLLAAVRRPAHALDALAAASILLLVIGVRNAWDIVVFLALRRLDESGGDR